jgi:hypothetical protein
MASPTSHHIDKPTARNLLARHVVMFYGLIALILAKWLYYDDTSRAMIRMVFIDLPAAMIFLYALPLAVLTVSVVRRKPISGLTFFRITGVMWLILLPSLWRLDLS